MFFSMRLCITITKLLNRTLNYLLEYLCINYVLVVFASYGYFHFLLFPPEMIKFTAGHVHSFSYTTRYCKVALRSDDVSQGFMIG